MSLLTIIRDAATDLNLVRPSTVITSSDQLTIQLLSLAKREGQDLIRRFDWQALTKEATFTTVATETQTTLSTVAADFKRLVDGSMNNRTQHWPVDGPLSPTDWQRKRSLGAQVGVRNSFRIRGDAILFYPTPNAGDSIYFEYISKYWVQSSAGTAKETFTADDDTCLIDEDIVTLGVKWRFLKAKGFDYSEEMRTYEGALVAVFGPDGGNRVVDMGGDMGNEVPAIPDGSWTI
jgi:hypothetical protein